MLKANVGSMSNQCAVAVCQQFKASLVRQAIPIVLCTSQREAAQPEWAWAQGAQAGLQKPFCTEQLIAVLQHLI